MSAGCPKCAGPLEVVQVDTIDGRMCGACRGLLMAHEQLMTVLDGSWRGVSEAQAEATPFRAPAGWQQEHVYSCPDCSQPMEKYGYMGLAAVQIDRCDPCGLVWLDANELQNMVLALARSNYRSTRAYRREQDQLFPMKGAPVSSVESADDNWLLDESDGRLLANQLLNVLLRS